MLRFIPICYVVWYENKEMQQCVMCCILCQYGLKNSTEGLRMLLYLSAFAVATVLVAAVVVFVGPFLLWGLNESSLKHGPLGPPSSRAPQPGTEL